MRIEGLGSLRREGTVEIRDNDGNAVSLKIVSAPLGFSTELLSEIPTPPVPEKVVGNNVKTGPIVKKLEDDPGYKAAVDRANNLQAAAIVRQALREEPSVQFESRRESFDSALAFHEATYREFSEMGLTGSELGRLWREVGRLNSLTDELLEKAEDFLGRDRTDTTRSE